jgi:putative tryptophan/tyrosine transport system substrate-binding protein
MRRRDFIKAVAGSAMTWPLVVRAQQAMPVIGLLTPVLQIEEHLRGFQQGLQRAGFVDGDNVSILYRSSDNEMDRLPALAIDLARRGLAVIVAVGHPAAFAAKNATATIPVLFVAADDPVKLGLVASLARPGGNLTGVKILATELVAKRLALLRELLPAAARVAVLVDPTSKTIAEPTLQGVESAARAMALQIQVLNASNGREIGEAFAAIERPDALFVSIGLLFTARRVQLATLAARHMVPMISGNRQITEAGGLMSYGADIKDAFRQLGDYAGRILKGEKPADLPVVQATKFELVINVETARILGLTVPSSLLATVDEVIE